MCYSAMVWADYRKYTRSYGADIDIHEFARLAERVLREGRVPMPKGMVDAFAQASTPAELEVKALLDQYAAKEATKQEGADPAGSGPYRGQGALGQEGRRGVTEDPQRGPGHAAGSLRRVKESVTMFEIACNASGLLEGRKPLNTEAEARTIAYSLSQERGEAFQVWGPMGLIDVIDAPKPAHVCVPWRGRGGDIGACIHCGAKADAIAVYYADRAASGQAVLTASR